MLGGGAGLLDFAVRVLVATEDSRFLRLASGLDFPPDEAIGTFVAGRDGRFARPGFAPGVLPLRVP